MQVVRQCSACASRTHLLNQSDISLLRADRSILSRGAACINFRSGSERVLFRSSQSLQGWRDSIQTRHLSSGRHDFPFTQVENLSRISLIRGAASLVTDSSSTFLSQTTYAFTDALSDYSKAVHARIAVQRRYLASLGKMTATEEDSFQQLINSLRTKTSDILDECKRFESSWITAVNLCKMAAGAAHASGAEQASITVRTNVQVAQSQVDAARKLSADAEKKLAETKVEEIQRMAEYTASRENSEEYEVHEAYLRED